MADPVGWVEPSQVWIVDRAQRLEAWLRGDLELASAAIVRLIVKDLKELMSFEDHKRQIDEMTDKDGPETETEDADPSNVMFRAGYIQGLAGKASPITWSHTITSIGNRRLIRSGETGSRFSLTRARSRRLLKAWPARRHPATIACSCGAPRGRYSPFTVT